MRTQQNISLLAAAILLSLGCGETAFAELKLPNGSERRPNLSADPFERAREAVKKLPSSTPKASAPRETPAVEPKKPTRRAPEPVPEPAAEEPAADAAAEDAAPEDAPPEEEQPFTQEFTLTIDGFTKTAGGVPVAVDDPNTDEDETPTEAPPAASTFTGLIDYVAQVNTGAAGFWEDGLFVGHVIASFGGNPSDSVGDLHGISSNAIGFSTLKITEAFYQHTFPLSSTVITAGIFDVNTDFVTAEYAGMFVNGAFGFDNTIANGAGPSNFPNTGLGVQIKTDLSMNAYVQTALFDGVPVAPATDEMPDGQPEKFIDLTLQRDEGVFSIVEAGWHDGEAFTDGYIKVAVGGWYLKQPMRRFGDHDGDLRPGTGGMYMLAEASIGEALGVFFRYGRADADFNQYSQFYAAGLNYKGLVPGREEDLLGVGFVQTRLSQAWLDAPAPPEEDAEAGTGSGNMTMAEGDEEMALGRGFDAEGNPIYFAAETAIEVTYSSQVLDWLMVQPSIQYVLQPSMDILNGNALVVGVRLQATY